MRKFSKIILLFISVLIALAVGELFLGVYYYKDNSTFYFFPPKLYKVFTPIENTFPGVSGSVRFITNSMGIRADELLEDHTYRILAIGGSTTENVYLDQEETWTYLLQYILNKSQSKHSVWVGNAGKSGRTSRHHLVAMRHLPLKFWKIDAIVVLMGVNDFSKRLAEDVNYDPDFLEKRDSEEQLLSETFINSRFKKPFYRKMRLWELKNRVKQSFSQNIQDDRGNIFIKWRRHRKNSISIREDLPDMSHAIEEYKKNINLMIDIAEKNAFRLIFLTQPTLWRADLPEGLTGFIMAGRNWELSGRSGKTILFYRGLDTRHGAVQ